LAIGSQADLIIARPGKEEHGMDAFYALNPQDFLLIMHKGNIRMFDGSLLGSLSAQGLPVTTFYKIAIADSTKYVQGNLPGLMEEIHSYYPELRFPAIRADRPLSCFSDSENAKNEYDASGE
jgi:hypothetical protein